MADEVDHYSIPALDTSGRAERCRRADIDSHKFLLTGGELLISRLNPGKSRVHLVPQSLARQSVASTEFVALRPMDVCSGYLRYFLLSEGVRQELDSLARSATRSHQRVDPLEILNLMVPEVRLADQRRIADFLDDRVARIDQIIAARQRQVEVAREEMDARWASLTGELAARWVPIRRFLISIADGPFGSSLKSEHYSDAGTRVIRLGDIGIGCFRNSDIAYVSHDYGQRLARHAVEPGDLVMAGLGDETWPLGRCAVVPADIGPAIVKADCYRLRLDPRIDHQFAATVLSSPAARGAFGVLSRGATRARLNTEVAREAELPFVGLDAQRVYVQQVRDLRAAFDRCASAISCQIALLQEYKQSLITAAVTGELDVTTASTRIPG